MTPPLRGIRHVALMARDLEASEKFWTGVMGYRVEWRPDADNVYITSGSDNIALHRYSPTGAAIPAYAPMATSNELLDHIGLAVPGPADVDAWAAHLRQNGVTMENEPKTHRDGSRSLYFREPGGVLVQIIHHDPISQ